MLIDFSNVNERLSNIYDFLTFSESQDFALLPMPSMKGPMAEEAKARAEYTKKVAAAKAQFDAKIHKIREKGSKGFDALKAADKKQGNVFIGGKSYHIGTPGAALTMSDSDKCTNCKSEDKPVNDMIQENDPDISRQQNVVNDILAKVHEKLSGAEDKKYTKEVLKKLRNPTVLSAITKLQESGVSNDKIVDKYVNNVLTKINGVSDLEA